MTAVDMNICESKVDGIGAAASIVNEDAGASTTSDGRECSAIMEEKKRSSVAFRPIREMTAQVAGGCLFTLLPVLEGKWSGDTISVDNKNHKLSSSSTIFFDHSKQGWDLRHQRASEDCHVSDKHYFLKPIAHGQAKIECAGTPENAIYQEQAGGSFATFTIQDDQGNLVISETWSLRIMNSELTRVTQTYESGLLSSIWVCKEKKI